MDYFVADAVGKRMAKRFEQSLELGDCIIVASNSVVSDGVEWIQNGTVSHNTIYVGDGKVVEATITGVKRQEVSQYYVDKYNIAIRRIKDITAEQQANIVKGVSAYIGKPYDYWQIFTLGIFHLFRKCFGVTWYWLIGQSREDVMICSELFCQGCLTAEIHLFPDINIKAVTPQMLYETDKMFTVKDTISI